MSDTGPSRTELVPPFVGDPADRPHSAIASRRLDRVIRTGMRTEANKAQSPQAALAWLRHVKAAIETRIADLLQQHPELDDSPAPPTLSVPPLKKPPERTPR